MLVVAVAAIMGNFTVLDVLVVVVVFIFVVLAARLLSLLQIV